MNTLIATFCQIFNSRLDQSHETIFIKFLPVLTDLHSCFYLTKQTQTILTRENSPRACKYLWICVDSEDLRQSSLRDDELKCWDYFTYHHNLTDSFPTFVSRSWHCFRPTFALLLWTTTSRECSLPASENALSGSTSCSTGLMIPRGNKKPGRCDLHLLNKRRVSHEAWVRIEMIVSSDCSSSRWSLNRFRQSPPTFHPKWWN